MAGARSWSFRHLFFCALTVSALLLCYRGLASWPNAVKPEVVSLWSPDRDRNTSVYVRPHKPTALLRPKEPCTGTEFLVVVVPSRPSNSHQRDAIRSTWGQWIAGDLQAGTTRRQRRPLQDGEPFRQGKDRTEDGAVITEEPYYVIWEDYLDVGMKRAVSDRRSKRQSTKLDDNINTSTPRTLTGRKVYRSSLKTYFGKVDPSLKYKLVFLLGRDANANKPSNKIMAEHARYGDILLEDFVDSYQNLTLKSIFLLKFMKESCSKAQFVAKVDDDIFLHVPNLQKTLHDKSLPGKLMMGCLFCNARPISNPWNKWYTPGYMFRGDKFPNYLSGTSYVMSANLVDEMLIAASSTPLFHLEDVYITGILAEKIGVRPQDNAGFSYQTRPINPCLYQNVTVGHEVEPGPMYKLWNLLHLEVIVRACKPLTVSQIRNYSPTNCKWD